MGENERSERPFLYCIVPTLRPSDAEAQARRAERGYPRDLRARGRVERFDRRGTEPFEPFEPFEFFQNRNGPLENSKISENFNIF